MQPPMEHSLDLKVQIRSDRCLAYRMLFNPFKEGSWLLHPNKIGQRNQSGRVQSSQDECSSTFVHVEA